MPPLLGPALLSIIPIPCWNYIGSGLSYAQRKEWAILDTFDALSPVYDKPLTLKQVASLTKSEMNASLEVFHGGNGIIPNTRRTSVAIQQQLP